MTVSRDVQSRAAAESPMGNGAVSPLLSLQCPYFAPAARTGDRPGVPSRRGTVIGLDRHLVEREHANARTGAMAPEKEDAYVE